MPPTPNRRCGNRLDAPLRVADTEILYVHVVQPPVTHHRNDQVEVDATAVPLIPILQS
jgi:CTP-dependent riboflavin kinase